ASLCAGDDRSRKARSAVRHLAAPIDPTGAVGQNRRVLTSSSPFGEMGPEEFRRHAHRLTDWIADYLAHSSKYPVLAQVAPGTIASGLPAEAPAEGESFESILADFEKILLPGIA